MATVVRCHCRNLSAGQRGSRKSVGSAEPDREAAAQRLARRASSTETTVSRGFVSAATISNIFGGAGPDARGQRLLVRQAYEQGQLLDPAYLTDDALYQLPIVDDNARILATQEIEKR